MLPFFFPEHAICSWNNSQPNCIGRWVIELLSAVQTNLKGEHTLRSNLPRWWVTSEPWGLQSKSSKISTITLNPQQVCVHVCVCVGPSSDGLSQAVHSPDKCNFKDQVINVGVSIIARGFNPCIHAREGCGAQVHKMQCVCVCVCAQATVGSPWSCTMRIRSSRLNSVLIPAQLRRLLPGQLPLRPFSLTK